MSRFVALICCWSLGCGARVETTPPPDGGTFLGRDAADDQPDDEDRPDANVVPPGEPLPDDGGGPSIPDAYVTPVDTGLGPAPSETGSGGSATGCPLSFPASGTKCTARSGISGDNFYCHYFDSETACADSTKCSNERFAGVTMDECSFKATDCADGASCGRVFELDGACIVACKRVCQCSPMTGKLTCRAINCP